MELWNDSETKALFSLIEKFKGEGKSRSDAFLAFSLQTGRKRNSVRNFYYKAIKELIKNKEKRDLLKIDISKHNVSSIKSFTKEEKVEILNKVKDLMTAGYSLRGACLKVADGDVKKMLRYQNKLRNVKVNESAKCKVISMPAKKAKLTESEINSLFLGLVKLIKKCAEEQAEEKYSKLGESANEALREMVVKLSAREKELVSLKKNFEILKNEKLLLKEEINGLRSKTADLLNKKMNGEKVNSLAIFMEKLEKGRDLENDVK